jgi:hypothetical protein
MTSLAKEVTIYQASSRGISVSNPSHCGMMFFSEIRPVVGGDMNLPAHG